MEVVVLNSKLKMNNVSERLTEDVALNAKQKARCDNPECQTKKQTTAPKSKLEMVWWLWMSN